MRLFRKSLLSAAVAALSVAAVLTVTAQPAQAETYGYAEVTAWAFTDGARPTTADANPAGDAPIGAARRAYYTFDITPYRKQVLHRASFFSSETSVADCGVTVPVEIWRTGPVKATTTWAKAPADLELLGQTTRGQGVICPGAYLALDVIPQIQAALARGEKTITFGVRLGASAENDPAGARTMAPFRLSMATNHAPTVSGLQLASPAPVRPCGTLEKHPTAGGWFTRFAATATDADGDSTHITYASWPVNEPEKRIESGSGNHRDLREFPDGTLFAWTARASDYDDEGPWGRTCYFTVDNTAPAAEPMVFSKKYPTRDYPGTGGPGVPGTFVFDAEGDQDVIGFLYSYDGRLATDVRANRPGGRARVEIAPHAWGTTRLAVQSYDRAGNRSPEREYQFFVRDSAPTVEVDVAGVGLPSTLSLYSRAEEVTAFGYAVDGGAEARVPAVDRRATAEVVFPAAGPHTVAGRAYAGRKLLGSHTVTFSVTDAPGIETEDFGWTGDPVSGVPGTFTFTPRSRDVVAYRYHFGGEQQTIEARPDGSAVLEWTPPAGGFYNLEVVSVTADGTVSAGSVLGFYVISTVPQLSSDYGHGWPYDDGVGRPVSIWMSSELPGVTGFVWSFDGGPESETSDGGNTSVEVVPRHAGENTVTARARLADGTLSPPATVSFRVTDAPLASVRGPYGPTPLNDREATLTFEPAVPGVVGYRYTVDGAEQHVAAGADGSATAVWTVPCCTSYQTLTVTSETADGTVSEIRTIGISIGNPAVSVTASWSQWWPSGGMGVPGRIGFEALPAEGTARYLWWVGDGPVQSAVPAGPGLTTWVPYTPDRTGELTVHARREFTDGVLSPVTEFRFLVGTTPLIEADRYQDGTWNGAAGEAGVFRFGGGMPDVVDYDYRISDYYDSAELAAGTVAADGAQVSFTPPAGRYYRIAVVGRTADGTTTDEAELYFSVRPGGA